MSPPPDDTIIPVRSMLIAWRQSVEAGRLASSELEHVVKFAVEQMGKAKADSRVVKRCGDLLLAVAKHGAAAVENLRNVAPVGVLEQEDGRKDKGDAAGKDMPADAAMRVTFRIS